jgi:hypothetical protein
MKALRVFGIVGMFILLVFIQYRYFPRREQIIMRDTVWVHHHHEKIVEKPVPVYVKIPSATTIIKEIEYLDCDSLKNLYAALWVRHNLENGYADTLVVDSIGYVDVSFKVFQNETHDLRLGVNLRRMEVTNTIIDGRPFITGGVMLSKSGIIPLVGVGKGNLHFECGYNGEMYVGGRYIWRFNPPRLRYLNN